MIENVLSQEQIQTNHDRFIELINSITRCGHKEKLIETLENSDFFFAPGSTKYHHNYPGGLCYHTLEVYSNLLGLLTLTATKFDEDSVKIISLFHDLSKINFYTTGEKNVKNEAGQWVKEKYYMHNDNNKYNVRGHEVNSMCLTMKFFSLTTEEEAAICNHHGGLSEDSSPREYADCCATYPLVMYLHFADMMSCYDEEGTNERNYAKAV